MSQVLFNDIIAAGDASKYDEQAKVLLSNKSILASIMKDVIADYNGMSLDEVINYIEADSIEVDKKLVDPGLTNIVNGRIVGNNTEDIVIGEGMIRFDIVFNAKLPQEVSGKVKIIVNVEAQKAEPSGYEILNRAIYYTCRLISSQKQKVFLHQDYDKIQRVYSIWVCMEMSHNSIHHVHLIDDILSTDESTDSDESAVSNEEYANLSGEPVDRSPKEKLKGDIDLFNIIMLHLTEEVPTVGTSQALNRLLGVLLSPNFAPAEKNSVFEKEFFIKDPELEREVEKMNAQIMEIAQRNFSKGREEGREEGRAKGREEGREEEFRKNVRNMHSQGLPADSIAKLLGAAIERVQAVLSSIQDKDTLDKVNLF